MYLLPTTQLQNGKYRIVRYIGSGGFGTTYEAEQVLLGERVAIKEFFVKDYCNRDASTGQITVGTHSKVGLVDKLKRKFLDEAKMLYRMQHPGIVRIFDIFEENGTAYFVMNYIDGPSLNEIVAKEGHLNEGRAVRYIRQIAEALKCVHDHGCLHLDIKPGNIMIDKLDNAILIDFGTSKQYDEVEGENTSTLLGMTPGYAPIEQIGNDVLKFTPATDIYALGATLYKLITGITPPSANLLASGEELGSFPEEVSKPVRELIVMCMATNKKNRPQNIDEFLNILGCSKRLKDESIEEDTIVLNVDKSDSNHNNSNQRVLTDTSRSSKFYKSKILLILIVFLLSIGAYFGYNSILAPYLNMSHDKQVYMSLINQGDLMLTSGNYSEALKEYKYAKSYEIIYENTKYSHHFSENTNAKIAKLEEVKYNGHKYVDLGLPSGLKWATCNIGASREDDFGNYYAWGEIQTKSIYNSNTSLTEGKSIGDISNNAEYDAAKANWGGTWRLPTAEEFSELLNACTCTWVTQGNKKGCKFEGPNGNWVFLPLAGHYADKELVSSGESVYYSTSTPFPDEGRNAVAYTAKFFEDSKHMFVSAEMRLVGCLIRPVSE